MLLVILVDLTPVQNFLARKATEMLSRKLKTTVRVQHVRIDFLNHVVLQGLYIEDQAHDTLLYAGEAQVRITDWFIFRTDKPVLRYLALHDAYGHLYRTAQSKVWNYQFVADAFQTGKKDTSTKQKEFEFDLKQIDLQNVRFHMDDAWTGDDMDYEIGSLQLDAKTLDFKKKILDVNNLAIEAASVVLKDYKGGKPKDTTLKPHIQIIDTTPFNPERWIVKVKNLSLSNSLFSLVSSDNNPPINAFDPEHIHIDSIKLDASSIVITGDTIHGNIDLLTAHERCGLTIRKMKSKVTVSPVASICENLYLETNYSKLQNYYAMRYRRFPDFTSYITNVVMEAHLQNAIVDERDVAYFAPILRQYPTILHVSGNGRGTVANLSGQNLQVTDGNTVIKGNFKMKGLPDIYTTVIDFDNGEILTTGAGILKYAPSLKGSPNIALEKLTYAYFKGDYTGYIENFALNGTLVTNLGTIQSNVKMNIPKFTGDKAIYSGTISTNSFDLGTLLRQPDLGSISLHSNVSGSAFDPQVAKINVDAFINQIGYNGYEYHNVYANGVLERKTFTGKLQVDDSNFAFEFNGNADFSQKTIKVNATASILKSNMKNLHFTKDTVTAVADFNVNFEGNSIDSFSGYAKLYNIDVKRNQHKLALDSIYLNSAIEGGQKTLTIQSNDIVATIKGNYQLTKLPASIQYYLAGYLPNYIKIPLKTAPEQNLTFEIKTTSVDSLLGVLYQTVRGFDNSVITGSLNTSQEKLTLRTNVPYGSYGNFHFYNVNINADGNFNLLGLSASSDNVVIGDSIINGSLSVTTTLGNDSMQFNIATSAPDANTSVTLNGQIRARHDSLYLTLLPSDFFLNQTKWNISGGSNIVYTDNYLLVKNLTLQSGLQEIDINTQYDNNDQSLFIDTKNLDLGQLGTWGGLAMYQPDGRINGSVKIEHLFKDLLVSTNLKATNVLFGTDSVGNVNLVGSYDKNKKLFSIDPMTGIYRGNSSIIVSGNWSFDTSLTESINGSIQFNNSELAWLSPFVIGYISNINGVVNGTISAKGSSDDPKISGSIALQDAGMKIDYLGTHYTIPTATITVDNQKIDVGNTTVYDTFKNTATLTGYISHSAFKNMNLRLNLVSSKFQIFNLQSNENNIFYGNLIAGFNPLSVRGPLNNISINVSKAVPAEKSHIFIPVSNSNGLSTYSYVSFKSYGKNQERVKNRNKNKLNIKIDATLEDVAELTLVLDPTTGDAITAKGTGNMSLEIPASNDVRMFGTYDIDEGDYTFTFKQLFFKRKFILNSGSQIKFNGPLSQTNMDVNATYTTRARLYDLLNDAEKQNGIIPESEMADAKIAQDVNVILHMHGSLSDPKLTFNIELPDKRSVGTYAYTKLERLNQQDNELFDQVASLLLVQTFIPPEGIVGSTAKTGAINNVSDILSTTASTQLTNIVNKLFGNKDLAVNLKYENYNLSDPTLGALNRNEVSLDVRKNYFNDRLIVEVGGKSDWGRPTSTSNTANFNLAGDFRIQYLIRQSGGLRFNIFRTSDYDVTVDRNINRAGVGISWRKSFNSFSDFIHGDKYFKSKELQLPLIDSSAKKPSNTGGTE